MPIRHRGTLALAVICSLLGSQAMSEAESPTTRAARGLRPWPITLPVVHVPGPPTIDGALTDEVWKDIPPVTNFVNLVTGQPARPQTEVRAVFDERAIYFAIVCREPQMDRVVSVATSHDGQVYRDNAVELFIRPHRRPGPYVHLAVNTIGTQFDERTTNAGSFDLAWNPKWTAQVKKQAKDWTVEIAIPFASLDVEPPMPAQQWLGNVTRVCGPAGELTTLARLEGGFHKPEEFVALRFCYGANEARVRIKYSEANSAQPAPPEPAAPPTGPELAVPALTYHRQPAKVAIDARGWMSVDGKLFFPRILFLNQGYAGIRAAGFNTILTGNDKPDGKGQWIASNLEILNAAQKEGLWVIFHVCNLFRGQRSEFAALRQLVLALKDHPALLGWYTADEPSADVTHPIKLRTAYALIKKLDANHPVFVLENVPAFFHHWAAGTCDVFMADPYVIPTPGAEQAAAWTDLARTSVGKGQTLMLCLQAHGPPWYTRYPTVAEARAMAWLAVQHGATGLGWWAHGPAKSSPVWPEYPKITAEAASLGQALRSASKHELTVKDHVHRLSLTVGGSDYLASVDCGKPELPTSLTLGTDPSKPATLATPADLTPTLPPPPAPPPPPATKPAPPPATATAPAPKPPETKPTPPPPPPPATKPAPPPPASTPAPPPKPPESKPTPPPPPPATKPAPSPATAPAPPPKPPEPKPAPPPATAPAPKPPPTTVPAPSPPPAPPATKPATAPASAPTTQKAEVWSNPMWRGACTA